MTDAEYAKALKRWEKACAEFDRTGGVHHVFGGPPETTATFWTADGAYSDGVWAGDDWLWQGHGGTS